MHQSNATNPRPFIVYDCFSDRRFGGNVGGVVLNADNLDPQTMQKIAREINAPVTGFVTHQQGREISVRFFMPSSEIAMCGHVTVGLFSYLTEELGVTDATFSMKTPAGTVAVQVSGDGTALPHVFMGVGLPEFRPANLPAADLAQALGLQENVLSVLNPPEIAKAGLNHLFVHMPSLEAVQNLAPDFRKLTELSNDIGVHTVACFAMQTETPENTLHIRDFCPAVGANEVPASGTTNGALAGYLVRYGLVAQGAQIVLAEQGNELGRPSLIRCDITSENGVLGNVRVGGQAVASLKGTIVEA
jgi:trans-2,3-dihydro-3-hydroxyanthranilate isomerase